jgi:hypothetical protein
MNQSPLLRDIGQLRLLKGQDDTAEEREYQQREILEHFASLEYANEIWEQLITHNGYACT